MSRLPRRLARALDVRRLGRGTGEVGDLRHDPERQDALVRDAIADLSERLAAIERRLAALEARDQ